MGNHNFGLGLVTNSPGRPEVPWSDVIDIRPGGFDGIVAYIKADVQRQTGQNFQSFTPVFYKRQADNDNDILKYVVRVLVAQENHGYIDLRLRFESRTGPRFLLKGVQQNRARDDPLET